MNSAIFVVQRGNGGAAMSKGAHASQKKAGAGGGSQSGLPSGVTKEASGSDTKYSFTDSSGNELIFDVNKGNVDFVVNGSIDAGMTSVDEGARLATKVNSIMKHDISTRPDGFQYSTSASVGDGLGDSRMALYARAGFSIPSGGAGKTQYGVVKNGKLVPSDDRGRALSGGKLTAHQRDTRNLIRDAARQRRQERREAENDNAWLTG